MKKEERIVVKINVKDVVQDTAQPRQDWANNEKALLSLTEDIKEKGMYYPIIVSPFVKTDNNELILGDMASKHDNRKWWILDGERRWLSAVNLGHNTIDAMVRTDLTMLEMLEIQFASNTKRLQVTITEMSKAVLRFRDEYKKEHGDYNEADFIKSLCSLTGFSSAYFTMVEAINRADEDMKESVLSDKVGGYAPYEIEKATKDEHFRRGITDAYLESEKQIGALVPRALKYDLKVIEAEENLNPSEKRLLAKQMVNDFTHKGGRTRDSEPHFLLYKQKAMKFLREVQHWNLNGLKNQEVLTLVGLIEGVYNHFKEDRRLNGQMFSRKTGENMFGTKATGGDSD
jgi:ParB/RepB/Spo0J family partition protein|tara:strand:+ start:567 stop:1598 length:1032 start_codon:yes stop_codon:yes gene_type:complete